MTCSKRQRLSKRDRETKIVAQRNTIMVCYHPWGKPCLSDWS